MASRRIKLIASASAVVLGVGGYFLYSVFAVQGRGTLAQAPLNVQAKIPPAFIMAVDDSGSMTFETLLPGRDGQAFWDNSSAGSNGFFNGAALRISGDTINPENDGRNTNGTFNHLLPYTGHRIDTSRFAIPPIDRFGFARSPEFNPAYFNPSPSVTYDPWKRPNATTNLLEDYPHAIATATRPDPDSAASTFNVGAIHYDRTDDANTVPVEDELFVVPQDTVLPAGTQYYITSECGNLGTSGGTRNQWTTVPAGGITVDEDCQVGIAYLPAVFYLKQTSPAPAGYVAGRVAAPNACGNGCDMWRYEITATMFGTAAPALLNKFADWFSFYGDRNRAMISGLTHSLAEVNDMSIGMFTINNRTATVPMLDMNVVADKATLYRNQLLALPASGSTPNRFAVDHIGRQFQRASGTNLPVKLVCQKNVGMLFTDGYSNQGSITDAGNADAGMPAPLNDAHSNTMADIAAKYYLANLRTDLVGTVPVPKLCQTTPNDPRLDCRTEPHMNFYGITLGARGSITPPGFGTAPYIDNPVTQGNEATTAAFTTPPAWQAWQNDEPSTVDEIWHATMNGRGEYINASTPADITAAMRRVIASVTAGASPSGSIALTGARIGTGSLTVSPFYEARNEGNDWYSKLTAQTVSSVPTTGEAIFTDVWEASARLPVAGARTEVWFGASTGAVRFTDTNVASMDNLCSNVGMSLCTGAQLAALGGVNGTGTPTPITLTQAVAYLKGDQTLATAERDGKLRFRTTGLGDIVNSTPVVSSPTDDYGYRSLPAPYGAAYSTYMTTGKANRRPMVFAGANDGMLHGFDGRSDASGGIERFAYIPQGVLGHMGNLLFPYKTADGNDQKFQHRYYVDGPLAVSDAYYAGGWKTALVGTTGAGGRGAFALDVSTVSNLTGAFSSGDRLWDINDKDTTLPAVVRNNIGYVLGKPVVVPVKTGTSTGPVKWRAIFGNGYNSTSGKAVLFLVDIAAGAPVITMIEAVETGTGVPAGTNGLGNIVVTDRWGPATDGTLTAPFRDNFADTVYAADQKGAIWKFDLRSATQVAPAMPTALTTPLFTTLKYTTGPEANTRQPILGGLTAAAGPGGSVPGGGVLIYFGTGSFSFNNDAGDTTLQSLYAVLDNGSGTTMTRTGMLQQTVGSTANGVRMTSSNVPIGVFTGWYLDLPAGERFVGYPRIESGVVFMPTYVPNATTGCGTDGSNWLYGLNALSGSAGLSNTRRGSPTGSSPGAGTGALSLNTGGTAPVKDVAVLTSPRVTPLGSTATPAELAAALGAQCSMIIQVAGAPPLYLPRACGRQSWRQIL